MAAEEIGLFIFVDTLEPKAPGAMRRYFKVIPRERITRLIESPPARYLLYTFIKGQLPEIVSCDSEERLIVAAVKLQEVRRELAPFTVKLSWCLSADLEERQSPRPQIADGCPATVS